VRASEPSPKRRMLDAYRGVPRERSPVAPEFWTYYPAKVLGVDMVQFELEVPFWKALRETFVRYGCEGWGAAFAESEIEGRTVAKRMDAIGEGRYRETTRTGWRGLEFISTKLFDPAEPAAVERRPVSRPEELPSYLEMLLWPERSVDLSEAAAAHAAVGGDYLLEFWLGFPFFDWVAEAIGFEGAVFWFAETDEGALRDLRDRYAALLGDLVDRVAARTQFESFVLGCSASCTSLLGTAMWREWDKPLIAAVAARVHARGKLLHQHFHGRSAEAAADFAATGVDCVCPFERPPGGDVTGLEGLREIRRALDDRVTMNGNVHTVETLIRGRPADVRREVREIKEAFRGSARCIIGTGDQVGRETPEENIVAMLEEGMKP
jgi:hypothetical protein